MGQAYEYLVGKFADDAGNTAQEFYTNRTVVDLMAEILQPRPGESIYDPTCGSGGMLVKCLDFLRKKGEPWQGVKVFGQEINALTSAIARMNLYLNGVEDFSIVREDTLAHPAFVDGSRLRKFDIVLANPPYSISEWNRTSFENDKWGRNKYGTPPQGRADYAFIQHIVCSMNEQKGRCAILLPHGVLFRKEETNVRTNLVLSNKIEAIIGLGPNLFYNAPMEACIIICNNEKRGDLNDKIIFVNAKNEVTRKNAESYLEKHHIDKILNAYHSNGDIETFKRVVDLEEIKRNGFDLSIQKYVFINDITSNETLGFEDAYSQWNNSSIVMKSEMDNLLSLLGDAI